MDKLKNAREAISHLQRELTRRRDKKLRELFCEDAIALVNRVALHLKYADDEGQLLCERAGQGLVHVFSKLNSAKQEEEVREMKSSLVNLLGIISRLNDIAQTSLFKSTDVAYETSKVKQFVQKLIQGMELYTSANCN
jgi:hypothetical protein